MKFQALINRYLTEAQKGSVGGHMSIEDAVKTVQPQSDVADFERSSDPNYLVRLVLAAKQNPEMDIVFRGKPVKGSNVAGLVAQTFFDPSSPDYIPLRNKNGQAFNQHELLTVAKQIGRANRMGDQKLLDYYKGFSKTPQFYVKWEQLLSLVTNVSETDIRQEDDTRSRYVTYTNAAGEKTQYRFHERTDDRTITRTPFSSSTQWMKDSIRPQAYADTPYGTFLKQFRATGGTLDDLADLIDGKIGA